MASVPELGRQLPVRVGVQRLVLSRTVGVVIDIVGGTIGLPDTLISVVSGAVFATGLAAVGLRVLLTL